MHRLFSRSCTLLAAAQAANTRLLPKGTRGCAPIHTSASAPSDSDNKAKAKAKAGDEPEADARHQEFCKSFLAALKEASTRPQEPLPVDKTAQAVDQQLSSALKELFAKYEVPATPALLEKRKQLRSSYPELFKHISDKDLDS
ncbi:hypothetical protein GGI20_005892, partial [Coemansia sp. BCRC 34301]